jgi:serine/threonine-protein kinase ULK/ATG1
LATLNERFRHCISMTKMLNSENLLSDSGIEPHNTSLTADRILYNYVIELCQSAALDELFGNPDECFQVRKGSVESSLLLSKCQKLFQRYHGAHILLHALQSHLSSDSDKLVLAKYKDAVERRLHILEQQGFVQAYETATI